MANLKVPDERRTKSIAVKVTAEEKEAIKHKAKAEDIPVSALVRRVIKHYLESNV